MALRNLPALLVACSWIVLDAAEALEFRKLVPDEDYAAYSKTLDETRVDVAKALAEKRPPFAALIERVEDGGQAAQAGLEPGWVVESYNGKLFFDHTLKMEPGGPDGLTRKTVVCSPQGEFKTLDFKPGKIGFTLGNWIHPEKFVLQKTPRGAWDRDMLIASQAWTCGRHDVAETALAKAQEAGMPDNPIARYYRALLALDRGADAEARTIWAEVMQDIGPDAISPYYLPGVRTYAWQYRDFGLLRRAVEVDAFMPFRVQPAIIDSWAKSLAAPPSSLLPLAAERSGKDLMPTVVSVPDQVWKNWRLVPAEFLHQGWTAVPGTPGKSIAYHFMPKQPVKNVLWEVTLAVGNAERPIEAFPNSVSFALMDRSQKGGDPRNIDAKRVISFSALEHADGMRWTGFGGGLQDGLLYTQRTVPWISKEEAKGIANKVEKQERAALPGVGKTIDLIFVRIGNEAELLVNGQTWAKLPVPDSVEDLGFFFQVVGAVVVVDRMALYPLRD